MINTDVGVFPIVNQNVNEKLHNLISNDEQLSLTSMCQLDGDGSKNISDKIEEIHKELPVSRIALYIIL